MADFSSYAPKPDPNGFAQANDIYAPNQAESERVTRQSAQITPYALDFLSANARPDSDRLLSPDELNARYGVEGYLSFSKPETQASADYKSRAAARRAYYDKTLSAYQLSGADSLWQSLKGGALDPVAIPTYFVGLGELKAGGAAGETLLNIGRGRLMASGAARAVGENLLAGTALEGANYGFKTAADEDYSFGQAFDNLTVGAVLGAGIGALGGHLRYSSAAKAAQAAGVGDAIAQAAAKHGEDAAFLSRMAQVESDFNAGAQSGKSSAGGLFQFTDPTWNRMGGGDKTDAALNADRAAQLASANRAALSKALRRPAEDWEVYLAHQQGEAGARKLLADPSARAADIVGEAAVVNNGGRADMTAGEFADMWRQRFDGGTSASAPRAALNGGGLDLMSPSERAGAFEKAMDDFLNDSPVDIAPLLPSEPRMLARVDDGADLRTAIPAKAYEPDVAVTTRGTEIPVRYAVADLKDLVTSHDDDLNVNPAYPPELQPRARERAGAIANNKRLEAELNPRRLMGSADAESGAPIIGKDGLVESGNGRTIALRRSAMSDGASYARYREALTTAGYDVSGVEHPVLVRVNTSDMSHGERIRWTKEANNQTVEQMSAGEQARVDASRVPNDVLAMINGSDFASAGNRDFMRAFIKHAAPDMLNSLTTKEGEISAEAVRRVKAAVLSRAYDNPRLVERMFEDADPNIKSIGRALQDAAPGWARLKALIADGRIPAEVDISADLNRALDLVMEARDGLRPLRDLILERIDQSDMLSGDAMSEAQIGLLRVMFKDADYKIGRSAEDITRSLDAYARRAGEISDGIDLLGRDAQDQMRESLQDSLRLVDQAITVGDQRVFTFRGQNGEAARLFETAGAGGDAGRSGRGQPGRGAAGGEPGNGPAPEAGGTGQRVNAHGLINADPELKQLAEDIATLDPTGEVEAGLPDNLKPETVAEAMRAVAFCMLEGGAK